MHDYIKQQLFFQKKKNHRLLHPLSVQVQVKNPNQNLKFTNVISYRLPLTMLIHMWMSVCIIPS